MIDLNTTVDEVLGAHPELASLFVRHRMICVGCAIARFHTVREVALMYKLDPDDFLGEIHERYGENQARHNEPHA
jgi:hybrid cluster-associated redox disulfide protein